MNVRDDAADAPVTKKPYVTPKLTVLGSVAELTRGVGGSGFDSLGAFTRTPSRPRRGP